MATKQLAAGAKLLTHPDTIYIRNNYIRRVPALGIASPTWTISLRFRPANNPLRLRNTIMSQGHANANDSSEAVQEPDQEAPKKAKSRRPASKTTLPSSSITLSAPSLRRSSLPVP